jgi:hypothetical protein
MSNVTFQLCMAALKVPALLATVVTLAVLALAGYGLYALIMKRREGYGDSFTPTGLRDKLRPRGNRQERSIGGASPGGL